MQRTQVGKGQRLSETSREGGGQHGKAKVQSSEGAVPRPVLEVLVIDLKEGKTLRGSGGGGSSVWTGGHPSDGGTSEEEKLGPKVPSELGGRVNGREDDVNGGSK